jgi:excisionase family DNA binding protein
MSAIVTAFLADLDDAALDRLAALLAPRLARLAQPTAPTSWLRGADAIAAYIGAPRSRVYALASAKRIPIERDGASLVARRSDLDEWIAGGGARRP